MASPTATINARPQRKYQNVPIMDSVEPLEHYEPGGLHPILLGEVLDDRFEVNYKLGYGGLATVWLCYDLRLKHWKAVKINVAERSTNDCPDLRAIKLMKDHGVDSAILEEKHIDLAEETFWLEGPNGRHLCAVLPVLGPTVYDWRFTLGIDELRVNDICYQITEGLAFLHSKGICHGDFRPDNILMKLRSESLNQMGREEMRQMLGPPTFATVLTTDGEHSPNAPDYVVTGVSMQAFRHLVADEIAIIDFGESFEISDPPATLGIPRRYAAPELIFGGHKPGPGSDMFALACTIYELRRHTILDDDLWYLTQNMERIMGPVPPPYRQTAQQMIYDHLMKEYEENGDEDEPKPEFPSLNSNTDGMDLEPVVDSVEGDASRAENGNHHYSRPLEKDLATNLTYYPDALNPNYRDEGTPVEYRLPHNEVLSLAHFLHQIFRYNPEERMGASKALKHHWFKRNSPVARRLISIPAGYALLILILGPLLGWVYLRSISSTSITQKPSHIQDLFTKLTGVPTVIIYIVV